MFNIISLFSTLAALVVPFLLNILFVLVIFFVGTKLIKLARKLVNQALVKSNADKGIITFLDSFVKMGLYALLIVIILGMVGVEMASIAAVIASAGVAVGLALQGSLSNLAGGVLILLLRPFNVDDYIIAGGMEGTVTEIQLFYTKLLTVDNRVIVMPNGSLSNGNIINVTAMDKRRLDITVGISYQADLKLAKDALSEMIKECPYTMQEEVMDVFVSSLGASSVVLNMRVWVKKEDYWTALSYLTEHAKLTLEANSIEIPYNKLDINVLK